MTVDYSTQHIYRVAYIDNLQMNQLKQKHVNVNEQFNEKLKQQMYQEISNLQRKWNMLDRWVKQR